MTATALQNVTLILVHPVNETVVIWSCKKNNPLNVHINNHYRNYLSKKLHGLHISTGVQNSEGGTGNTGLYAGGRWGWQQNNCTIERKHWFKVCPTNWFVGIKKVFMFIFLVIRLW